MSPLFLELFRVSLLSFIVRSFKYCLFGLVGWLQFQFEWFIELFLCKLVNLVAPALHCTKIVFAIGPAKSKIEKKKVFLFCFFLGLDWTSFCQSFLVSLIFLVFLLFAFSLSSSRLLVFYTSSRNTTKHCRCSKWPKVLHKYIKPEQICLLERSSLLNLK
jgi:hypothetical protein